VWRLGAAWGYEHSTLQTDTNAEADGDRLNGGAVLKYNPGALLLAAAVSGGWGWYDTDRPIAFPGFSAVSSANNEIGNVTERLRAAYLFTNGAWYAKPMVDFDTTQFGPHRRQGAWRGRRKPDRQGQQRDGVERIARARGAELYCSPKVEAR
jgi:uncharacterized protein with beta-barrel porin domain